MTHSIVLQGSLGEGLCVLTQELNRTQLPHSDDLAGDIRISNKYWPSFVIFFFPKIKIWGRSISVFIDIFKNVIKYLENLKASFSVSILKRNIMQD